MENTTGAKHVRFYQNGASMTMNVTRELTNEIKDYFSPLQDYSAVFDPEKGTLTIFKPIAP